MSGHLSSEQLDLLELGALSPGDRDAAEAHLAGCGACAAQRASLQEDAAAFRQYVQPRTAQRVAERVAPRRFRPGWPGMLAGALAASLLVVIAARLAGAPADDGYLAIRGEAVVKVIVAREGSQAPLASGDVLRGGDRLRFQVEGAGASHVLILSRDPAGAWSVYAPYGGQRSVPIGAGEQLLAGAVELDDSRGTEHLVAVFSDRPLEAAAVISHLRDRPLPLRPGALEHVPGARTVQVLPFEKS